MFAPSLAFVAASFFVSFLLTREQLRTFQIVWNQDLVQKKMKLVLKGIGTEKEHNHCKIAKRYTRKDLKSVFFDIIKGVQVNIQCVNLQGI